MLDKRAYSGAIYDIIKFDLGYDKKFVLPRDIQPLYRFNEFVFGKAFTARGDKTSTPNLRIIDEMVDEMDEGDVYSTGK